MGDEGFRPPQEHADKRLHWVEKDSVTAVWQWDNGVWSFGRKLTWPPDAPYCKGYRYLGPAEWREPAFWEETANKAKARISALEAENTLHRASPPLLADAIGSVFKWDADVGQWKPTGVVQSGENWWFVPGIPRWHSHTERGPDGWPALAPNAAAVKRWQEAFGDAAARGLGAERVTPNETVRIDLLAALPDEPRAIDAPDDPVHRAVRDTIDHLAKGLVTPPARKALRDSLDKADAPPVGRAKADQGLGRAVTRVAGVVAPEFGEGAGFRYYGANAQSASSSRRPASTTYPHGAGSASRHRSEEAR